MKFFILSATALLQFLGNSAFAAPEYCNMHLAASDLKYEIERDLPSRFDVMCYMKDEKCSSASCFVHNTINDDGLPDAELFCELTRKGWYCKDAEAE